MHSQTDIPPCLVFWILVAVGAIGGIVWLLVAIPVAGTLPVLTGRVVAPLVRAWSGAEGTEE